MEREEWYNSVLFKKTRLLHNQVFKVKEDCQIMRDMFEILAEENLEKIIPSDKYHLLERQLRVVELEADNLKKLVHDFNKMIEPRKFDEPQQGKNNGEKEE